MGNLKTSSGRMRVSRLAAASLWLATKRMRTPGEGAGNELTFPAVGIICCNKHLKSHYPHRMFYCIRNISNKSIDFASWTDSMAKIRRRYDAYMGGKVADYLAGSTIGTRVPDQNQAFNQVRDHIRRSALRGFAVTCFQNNPNKCGALVDVVRQSSNLIKKDKITTPANTMMDDLLLVMIGKGLTSRGTGQYFFMGKDLPFAKVRGACGFKNNMSDNGVQVSHAVAGIYIGYYYSAPIRYLVRSLEGEPQDVRLYDTTFPLGTDLTDSNYEELWSRLKTAICHDNSDNCLLSDKVK